MKLFWLFSMFFFIGCVEKSNFTIEDFDKHPEIRVFLIDTIDLKATHFIDPAWLHFSYKSKNISPNKTVSFIDSIAQFNNWEIIKTSENKRNYLKLIKSYPADNSVDTLYFIYDADNNVLNFKWH